MQITGIIIEHLTNNASESFNNYLNNLFSKKTYFL